MPLPKSLLIAVIALSSFSDGAEACGIIEGGTAYWVDNADVIVRVRASEQRDRPSVPGDDPYLRPGG